MRRFLRNNGLTIILLLATALSIGGMMLAGWKTENGELARHGEASLTLAAYLQSGTFLSALFENWESEFLQMSAYVMLTAYLFQKGSAESRDPDEAEEPSGPLPPPRSISQRWLYEHSLGLALAILFLLSFVLHLLGSAEADAEEAIRHGETAASLLDHLASAPFWFESFQNWQSEFLSTAVLVVLSIFLRYRGSPESKPVTASDSDTGN